MRRSKKPEEERSELAKAIKRKRKEQHLTQAKFAQKYGVANVTVSRWENDDQVPRHTILAEMGLLNFGNNQPVMESNVHLEIEEPPISEDVIEIPVLSPEQTACCGRGIPSAECTYDNKESVQVQKKLIGRMCEGKMPFAIIAEGSSMERWGIEDGSRVVINPVEEVHDFDIVLVCYRDNLALKKVQRRPDGSINLLSADGDVIMVTQEEAEVPALFEIWGKAMYYRQVRAGTIKHGL